MQLHIKITGALFSVLALAHIVFPKYFQWKKELVGLSLVNRQMMYVHTLFIALVVLLMGILCFTSADAIVGTELGRRLALGLGVFWGVRLLVQFFGYSSKLWRGKRFETAVHIVFSVLWLYVTVVFFRVFFSEIQL